MVVGKAERTNGVDGWGVVSVVTRDGYDWSAGSLGKGSARRASRRQITSKDMRPGFPFFEGRGERERGSIPSSFFLLNRSKSSELPPLTGRGPQPLLVVMPTEDGGGTQSPAAVLKIYLEIEVPLVLTLRVGKRQKEGEGEGSFPP